MKLLILSDSHGDRVALGRAWEKEQDADALIFLGDGIRELETLQAQNPAKRMYFVRGNCDVGSPWPDEGLAAFDGVLFFYTHGHEYSAKMTLGLLAETAAARGAQVALYGHTHHAMKTVRSGVTLFNPGALGGSRGGSYGVITTAPGGILRMEHRTLY